MKVLELKDVKKTFQLKIHFEYIRFKKIKKPLRQWMVSVFP